MAETTDQTDETVTLRAQIAQLQEELVEQAARYNAAVGDLQDRLERSKQELARARANVAELRERQYWLDRAHIDPNALMRSRAAQWARAAVRAIRAVVVEVRRRPER